MCQVYYKRQQSWACNSRPSGDIVQEWLEAARASCVDAKFIHALLRCAGLQYETLHHAISFLQQCLYSVNLKSGYCQKPHHPDSHPFVAVQMKGRLLRCRSIWRLC